MGAAGVGAGMTTVMATIGGAAGSRIGTMADRE